MNKMSDRRDWTKIYDTIRFIKAATQVTGSRTFTTIQYIATGSERTNRKICQTLVKANVFDETKLTADRRYLTVTKRTMELIKLYDDFIEKYKEMMKDGKK